MIPRLMADIRTLLEEESCPSATLDIATNLKNRQRAIDVANYGPANPNSPGDYWDKKAAKMKADVSDVTTMLCGNCAFFNIKKSMIDCIEQGIGNDAYDVVEAGKLGFCEAFDFKCAAKRTCDAWVVGGPLEGR